MAGFAPKLLPARPRSSQALQPITTIPFSAKMLAQAKPVTPKKNKKQKGLAASLAQLTGQF